MNTRKVILGIVVVIIVYVLFNLFMRNNNQVVIPDLSNDKTPKEMGTHILSANSWFTCPDENGLADWMRPFIKSEKIGTGENFTEDDYMTLFKDNQLNWSCLVTNVEKYVK
ncbi:MAG: hypothetical protein Q8P26_01335 [Candidatus Levybacteria bacterium]|nr:hypothetical protein [Candidatus Levybacteria bacterium]